jgi:hypothetical protein
MLSVKEFFDRTLKNTDWMIRLSVQIFIKFFKDILGDVISRIGCEEIWAWCENLTTKNLN